MLDERLRKLAIASLENKQFQSAEFYGNKLVLKLILILLDYYF